MAPGAKEPYAPFVASQQSQRRLRLAVNGRFLTRPMTGVDRVAAEVVQALANSDAQRDGEFDLRILMPGAPDMHPAYLDCGFDQIDHVRANRLSGHIWEQLELPRMARKDEWLLNLCNTGPISRARQVCMIHDAQFITSKDTYSWKFRALYRAVLPRIASKTRILLTVSEYSRKELETLQIIPENKAIVIRNGADHIDRIEADAETLVRFDLKAQRYFFVLGSLAAHKNIEILTDLAETHDLKVPLVIAGGGNLDVFKSIGIMNSPAVRVLGRIQDAELKALLSGATALLFPSKTEGFGLPPLEAMRCGCPVIATTGGAVPEVCGQAPIYADPDRPEQWVAAMESLLASPDLRSSLARRGKAHAANFTWSAAADQILTTLFITAAR